MFPAFSLFIVFLFAVVFQRKRGFMFFPQDPFVQKPHLILGVKPVLAAVHNRETGVVLFRKAADGSAHIRNGRISLLLDAERPDGFDFVIVL